jgi:pimeloyl-ACP methyl ester carboxylesterase
VVVHGLSGDPRAVASAFRPLAARHRTPLLVPHFEPPRFKHYQRLAGEGGPLEAARAFDDALSKAAAESGLSFDRVDLIGFSGGAQFAHRYAMLFPLRVRRVVVAGAGWYSYLDPARPFPVGSGPSDMSGGSPVEADRFLAIPVRIMVGENDVRRDGRLRKGEAIDAEQGSHRLSRALRWLEHLRAQAEMRDLVSHASFELLPRTGHSFRQAMRVGMLGDRAFRFLEAGQDGTLREDD